MLLSYIKDESSECLSNYQDFLCSQGEFESFVISLKKNHQSFWEKSNIVNSLSFKESIEDVINNSFLNYSNVEEDDVKKFISDFISFPNPNSKNKENNISINIQKEKKDLIDFNKPNDDRIPLSIYKKRRISKRKAKYKQSLLKVKESHFPNEYDNFKKISKKKRKIVNIFFILKLKLSGYYYIYSFIMIKKSFIYIKKIKKKKFFEIDKKRANKRIEYRNFINHRKKIIRYYLFRNLIKYFLSSFYQKIIKEYLFSNVDIIKNDYLSNNIKSIFFIKVVNKKRIKY